MNKDLIDYLETKTEDICIYCLTNIIPDLHKGVNWLCEGSWCSESTEMYIVDNEDEIKQNVRLLKLKKINDVSDKS